MALHNDFAKWQLTDAAARVMRQATDRALDRGYLVWDNSSAPTLALWSVLRWERKVGLVALECMGVDLPSIERDVDALLNKQRDSHPVFSRNGQIVDAKNHQPILLGWRAYIEPVLDAASAESKQAGPQLRRDRTLAPGGRGECRH